MEVMERFQKGLLEVNSALQNNQLDKLTVKDFRVFIDCTRQPNDIPEPALKEASETLLLILRSCHFYNESQIVISTAYSNVIACLLPNTDDLFNHFIRLLERKNKDIDVHICYSILQLNNTHWNTDCNSKEKLFLEIFDVLQESCCELKPTTYLAFKALNLFLQKVQLSYPSGQGFPEKWFVDILLIVLANWENPLTGIRQMNSSAFSLLLEFNEDIWKRTMFLEGSSNESSIIKHENVLKIIFKELSWAIKSKYFLLTEILSKANVSEVMSIYKSEITGGLHLSLQVTHLVSAGTDLYRKILDNLTPLQWKTYFEPLFFSVIRQKNTSLEVENIFNYWLPLTVKKLETIDALVENSGFYLYSFVSLLNIARKEGLPAYDWESLDKAKVTAALQDFDDKTRCKAFSLVCTSSKTLSSPLQEEFDFVQMFLRQNVNSDNTALRQNLLNSFTNFIVRVRDSLLHTAKMKQFDSSSNTHSFKFLDWLHSFLLFNLEDGCNYQRRVTSLEIYKIVLNYFGESLKEKSSAYRRKSNKAHLSLSSLHDKFLWEFKFNSEDSRKMIQSCLFDEDNEVRLSSAFILMNYFKLTDSHEVEFKGLFEAGKNLCLSEIFYKAEGGALIIKVLVTLAYNSSSEKLKRIVCKDEQNYVSALLSSCEAQFRRLKEDLLKAAVEGSFLYGTLQALNLLLTDNDSPEFMLLDENQLERLLSFMEEAVNHLVTVLSSTADKKSEYAPSFGEMGMAVAAVVDKSSLSSAEITAQTDTETSELQLSPAQQLVLSCIWLNIKECTKLSSRLVARPLSPADVKRCFQLVIFVLRRCRHKGAIESAGLALYHITQQVTASKNEQLIDLPNQLINEFFQSLLEHSASTVSRRSAGLAILVHRLITGDNRQRKPLLHSCIAQLLPIASKSDIEDTQSLVDLPQSQALHFLRTLVQESSLREHMAQYTLTISLIAVNNLASPIWTIRNAALQLFGALVPKLVGQKPHQEEGTGHHYLPFEELYVRAKPLIDMMLTEFASAEEKNCSTAHSKLMPLLTLITNLCLGLQTVISEEVKSVVAKFRTHLENLLASDIYNVRKLSAKAHSLFLTTSEIVTWIFKRSSDIQTLIDTNDISQNKVHGYLLNLVSLNSRFKEDKYGMEILMMEEENVLRTLKIVCKNIVQSDLSYFVKSLVFELAHVENVSLNNCTKGFALTCPLFIEKLVTNLIQSPRANGFPKKLNVSLINHQNRDIQISCLKVLKLEISSEMLHSDVKNILVSLLKMMTIDPSLRYRDHEVYTLVLENILITLDIIDPTVYSDIENSCSEFLSKSLRSLNVDFLGPIYINLMPVTCGLLVFQKQVDMEVLEKLTKKIKDWSNPSFSQDIRLSGAKSLYLLTNVLLVSSVKENNTGKFIWEACINFLQDEITDVRFEASKFVNSFFVNENRSFYNKPLSSFASLETLFEFLSVSKVMSTEVALDSLWKTLTSSSAKKTCSPGIMNPFDHNVESIFAEETVTSHLAFTCLVTLFEHIKHVFGLRLKMEYLCSDFITLHQVKYSNTIVENVLKLKKLLDDQITKINNLKRSVKT